MKGTDYRAMCKRQWAADAVVLGWMGIGFTLDLTPNVYLLVGIPITLAFQRYVAKRPLRALWRPPTAPFRMDTKFFVVVSVLGVLPAVSVVHDVATGRFVIAAWNAAAIAGAVGAADAFRATDRATWRSAAMCTVIALLLGLPFFLHLYRSNSAPVNVLHGIESFALYVPVSFALEEVFFRGALDPYVDPDNRFGWRSALPVAIAWGLWHLPLVPPGERLRAVGGLCLIHGLIGLTLAYFRRRTGNLWPAALAHAALDAVRNALRG